MKMGVRISIEIDQFEKILDALIAQAAIGNLDEKIKVDMQRKIDRIVEDGLELLHRTKIMSEKAKEENDK